MNESNDGRKNRNGVTRFWRAKVISKIRPRFSIRFRFVSLVILASLLTGGVAGFVAINTNRDSLRQEVLRNNLDRAELGADFASHYISSIQENVRYFASRPSIVQAVLDNEPERVQVQLTDFIEGQTKLITGSILDADGIQRVYSQTNVATIGQSYAELDYFVQVSTTLQPYLGVAAISKAIGLPVIP